VRRVAIAVLLAGLAAAPAAGTAVTRTAAVANGDNSLSFSVPHFTGARPPAILFETRPTGLHCAVRRYTYQAVRSRGQFQANVRCRAIPAGGGRVRLLFRSPFVVDFALTNGVGPLTLNFDKPAGNGLPDVELTTRPEGVDCRVSQEKVTNREFVVSATARVRCRDLPAHARGVLNVGGLLAGRSVRFAGPTPAVASDRTVSLSIAPHARPLATASATEGCGAPESITIDLPVVGINNQTYRHIRCTSRTLSIPPWWTIQYSDYGIRCPQGWRIFGLLSGPAIRHFEPSNAPYYESFNGVWTNWSLSDTVRAWLEYDCYSQS
jgi:hypothetical protein